jgi:hypothetical protein
MTEDDLYPPFITGRSPSYERARDELARPSPPHGGELVAALARLSEAEENARTAYLPAADKLTDPAAASQARAEAAAHGAHRGALAGLIEEAGGAAPRRDECRALLVAGAAVADAEGDAALGQALAALHDELRSFYDDTLASPLLDRSQHACLATLR